MKPFVTLSFDDYECGNEMGAAKFFENFGWTQFELDFFFNVQIAFWTKQQSNCKSGYFCVV